MSGGPCSYAAAEIAAALSLSNAEKADYLAARELSRMIGLAAGVSPDEAFDALTSSTPRNLSCLLASPEGWAALAEYTSACLGKTGSPISLPVH